MSAEYTLSNGQQLEAERVYDIHYHMQQPVQEFGTFAGFWTGNVDTWGKLTFRNVNTCETLYLFGHELQSVERWTA